MTCFIYYLAFGGFLRISWVLAAAGEKLTFSLFSTGLMFYWIKGAILCYYYGLYFDAAELKSEMRLNKSSQLERFIEFVRVYHHRLCRNNNYELHAIL